MRYVKYFNPRSRVGSDRSIFNHATPHLYFNPRSRVGSDALQAGLPAGLFIFQSTLPRGERRGESSRCQMF